MKTNEEKKRIKKNSLLKKCFKTKTTTIITISLIAILAICVVGIGLKKIALSDSKTTKIGFEDIGQLATQSAYCTEINVTDASVKLFGHKMPFTQSKYIYSYDVEIKAGYNFSDIKWKESRHIITVKLPEATVLSCDVKWDTFKVYHEKESIFRNISLEENNQAIENLTQTATDDAIANGLLDNARTNAETILTGFFAQSYNLKDYEIRFTDK